MTVEGTTLLPDFSLLSVTGADAATFLQGQVTCDVVNLPPRQAGLGAFCSPKGRVISTFIIWRRMEDFVLLVPADLAMPLLERLSRYVLRAKVELSVLTDQYAVGIIVSAQSDLPENYPAKPWAASEETLCLPAIDGVRRWLTIRCEGAVEPTVLAGWQSQDICLGWPWLTLATSEHYIPQSLNLDKLGAVSFNKGCYTGQEIVARTHYLGKAKRSLFIARTNCDSAPEANAEILDLNKILVGHVLSGVCFDRHCYLQAILPSDTFSGNGLVLAAPTETELQFI